MSCKVQQREISESIVFVPAYKITWLQQKKKKKVNENIITSPIFLKLKQRKQYKGIKEKQNKEIAKKYRTRYLHEQF